nr:hypothetical protein [Tanacetum cinerariifolium]
MAFPSAVASRFTPSNNQLRTSSNHRNQATIQDGKVTIQQVQGRQNQREGHMVRRCTHPKRPRNAAWFKKKLMLAEAHEAGQILDEEKLAFLTEDLDAYDLDCDDLSLAKAVRMANLSRCDPDVLSKSVENLDLNAQLQEKVFAIAALKNELRNLKGKNVVDTAVSKPSAIIAPGMFKLDIEPISHRLKNNKDVHEELLVYISKTCPSLTKPCEKLVVVTPMIKDKKIRVKPTTSASGSKPSGNTKNNKILQPPSSNKKNKVEDHSSKVKSSLNKMNSVSERVSNALVKHSVRNAKFKFIYAICNKCLFDTNHDMCIVDYVNGRTFTIVGNKCPLTRITSTKVVPTKETSTKSVATPTQGILVYSRRLKATRSVGSSSKVKIVESKNSNFEEPKQSWGSTVFDVSSSSLNDC